MQKRTIPTILFCGLLAAFPMAQESSGAPPSEVAAPDTGVLIQRLGDTSYAARQDAEARLRELGPAAVGALQKAAEEDADPEIRWRARRLARQIDRGDRLSPRGPHRSGRSGRPVPGDRAPAVELDDVFDSVFERLERDFDLDIPRRHFFHDDFFQDLRQQMDQLRQLHSSPFMGRSGAAGQSVQLQITPDGVRLQVEEKGEDGESETKTYEAPDLDRLREEYPDVAERYLGGVGGGLRFGWGARPQRDARGAPRFRALPNPFGGLRPGGSRSGATPMDDRGPRLGIYARPIGEDLRAFLGLESPRQGLLVDRVIEGSLAERLGVQASDVVLEIDGRAVSSPLEIRQALAAAGAELEVKVNRRGEDVVLKGPNEADAERSETEEMPAPKRRLKPSRRAGN
ncbi:MAG: PDZ domain-containing protein [Planctomycetota bacterium]